MLFLTYFIDIILGDDFLELNNAIIHQGEKTFSFLNEMIQVPLCIRGPPHIVAITPYEIKIPPNSQQILQVQFPYCKTNKVLMLEKLNNRNAVVLRVCRTLVSVHGRKYCPIWNDSDQPITLKYGTPIATVSPFADIVRSCTVKESIGDICQQSSTIDPDTSLKYVHNLNILNKNNNVYTTNKQQNARNHTYVNTGRHS